MQCGPRAWRLLAVATVLAAAAALCSCGIHQLPGLSRQAAALIPLPPFGSSAAAAAGGGGSRLASGSVQIAPLALRRLLQTAEGGGMPPRLEGTVTRQLDWLQAPPSGWEVWELPPAELNATEPESLEPFDGGGGGGGGGGVVSAASLSSSAPIEESEHIRVARLVVAQLASQLGAGSALGEASSTAQATTAQVHGRAALETGTGPVNTGASLPIGLPPPSAPPASQRAGLPLPLPAALEGGVSAASLTPQATPAHARHVVRRPNRVPRRKAAAAAATSASVPVPGSRTSPPLVPPPMPAPRPPTPPVPPPKPPAPPSPPPKPPTPPSPPATTSSVAAQSAAQSLLPSSKLPPPLPRPSGASPPRSQLPPPWRAPLALPPPAGSRSLPPPQPKSQSGPPPPLAPLPFEDISTQAVYSILTAAAPTRGPILPAAFNTAFPPRALPRAPTPLRAGCLGPGNVKRFGAVGDGLANDIEALRRALANKAVAVLWFPVGVYRLRGNITITKPVVMGSSTRFLLDPGSRLLLTRQPKRAPIWHDPMFTGAGTVRMGQAVKEVYPAWWSAVGRPDSNVLQAAINSCNYACTVLLTRQLDLASAVSLTTHSGVFATAAANVVGAAGGSGEGLVLPAGTYSQPLSFAGIRAFSRFGLKVRAGARNANIQAGHVSVNGDGIVFESAGTAAQSLTNITVSHVSVMQTNQNSIVFDASGAATSVFSGVTARVNFLLTGGMAAPNKPSAGVLFRGRQPVLTRTQVITQAIDPAQFLNVTRFVAVATATATPVSNFVFRSDCWNGGYEVPGALVAGRFQKSAFAFSFTTDVGKVLAFSADSSDNVLVKGEVGEVASAAGFWGLEAAPGSQQSFNKGLPVEHQGFYLSLTVSQNWAPGEQRTLYTHTYFANPALTDRNMPCVPFRAWNPGLTCVSVTKAPTSTSPHRVAVTLINLSKKAVPAGFFHRFGIQVGP